MSAFESTPVRLYNSEGDLIQLDSTKQAVFAEAGALKIISQYDSVGARYAGSLTITNTALDSAIGSFTDNFYNEAVGTHPGSSLTTGSTTTTLRQMIDSVGNLPFTGVYPNPIVTDSVGALHDMDSDNFALFSKRIAETIHNNELVGSFRLSATSPGAEWGKWIDDVFSDTVADNTTEYHIWRKNTSTVLNYNPIKRLDSNSFQEMTNDEAGELGNSMIQYGYEVGGIGEYELRTSAQGVPTAPGTWVARGTATDTRYTLDSAVQYTSVQYTSPQFARQYSGLYTGQYTGFSSGPVPGNFAGTRPAQYTGSRSFTPPSGGYGGSRNYAGNYASPDIQFVSGNIQFTGTSNPIQFTSGNIQFAGLATFLGTRQYTGQRVFTGRRNVPTTFSGVRATQYAGTRQFAGVRNFTGTRQFTGERSFAGVRDETFASHPGGFTGTRPAHPFQPIPVTWAPPTNPFSPGILVQHWTGVRNASFSVATQFAGELQFASPAQFTSASSNFAGDGESQFAGFAISDVVQFFHVNAGSGSPVTQPTSQFTSGNEPFVGPYQWVGTRQFTGTRPAQYTGTRQFTGVRDFAGSRNYAGNYAGFRSSESQFLGTNPQNFAGVRTAQYTRVYSAQYTGQYTSNYTSQYSAQYSGDTLVAIPKTLETYTLYVRVSET